MPPPDAIVFDFDGLIVDTETVIFDVHRDLFQAHGQMLTIQDWAHCIGTHSGFDPWDLLAERTGGAVDRAALDESAERAAWDRVGSMAPLPGVLDLIDAAASAGVALAVASSSSHGWVSTHLRGLGVLEAFGAVRCRDHVTTTKPAPDLYLEAARALGVEPGRSVALEDSVPGLAAAKAAGMRAVAVPGPMTAHMDFSGADLVAVSLAAVTLAELRRLF